MQEFGSHAVSSIHLGQGTGPAHVYALHFAPGGRVGDHRTGFDQLFLVVEGRGWIAGSDGRPHPLVAGQGAYLRRGEIHSKGSEEGMTAIMVQADDLQSGAPSHEG